MLRDTERELANLKRQNASTVRFAPSTRGRGTFRGGRGGGRGAGRGGGSSRGGSVSRGRGGGARGGGRGGGDRGGRYGQQDQRQAPFYITIRLH